MQYKDVIRDQDTRMQELTTELSRLRVDEAQMRIRVETLETELTQQRDENVLLRACAADKPPSDPYISEAQVIGKLHAEVSSQTVAYNHVWSVSCKNDRKEISYFFSLSYSGVSQAYKIYSIRNECHKVCLSVNSPKIYVWVWEEDKIQIVRVRVRYLQKVSQIIGIPNLGDLKN